MEGVPSPHLRPTRSHVLVLAAALAITAGAPGCEQKARAKDSPTPQEKTMQTLYDFQATDVDGKPVSLDRYRGKVVLIVNVASKCGFTPQYEGLEQLHRKHREQGLVVLGFPCNQFGEQEPGTESEIKAFCSSEYGVSFPIFSKIEVNGPGAHPLYAFLREQQPGAIRRDLPGADRLYDYLEKSRPDLLEGNSIRWNFTKFLVDRQGRVVKRFESVETPEAIEPEIVALLGAK